MHPSAMENAEQFYEVYHFSLLNYDLDYSVVEIGSQDVNGSLRTFWKNHKYTGVDFVDGPGVDLVLTDAYKFPIESESVDLVLSSSVFEHSEMFWLTFLEIMRILKPHGLFYLNVPSNGHFHRWPVDCWRFYPDAGSALVTWANKNGIPAILLESYISKQSKVDDWNDFVAVFLKDKEHEKTYSNRIIDFKTDFYNGKGGPEFFKNKTELNEDLMKLSVIKNVLEKTIRVTF